VSQDIRTASGRRAVDSDDAVARELRGMELADVYERAAQELDVSVASLHKLYDHLNAGMQRMNLGNRIRGAIKARSS
jgi:colicin import membrane protein